jgi:hypothetical protein
MRHTSSNVSRARPGYEQQHACVGTLTRTATRHATTPPPGRPGASLSWSNRPLLLSGQARIAWVLRPENLLVPIPRSARCLRIFVHHYNRHRSHRALNLTSPNQERPGVAIASLPRPIGFSLRACRRAPRVRGLGRADASEFRERGAGWHRRPRRFARRVCPLRPPARSDRQ